MTRPLSAPRSTASTVRRSTTASTSEIDCRWVAANAGIVECVWQLVNIVLHVDCLCDTLTAYHELDGLGPVQHHDRLPVGSGWRDTDGTHSRPNGSTAGRNR